MSAPVNQSAYQFDGDTAATVGDRGPAILVVRKDVAGSLVGADGRYTPLQVNSTGLLSIALPPNAATEASLAAFKTENDANLDAANATLTSILTALTPVTKFASISVSLLGDNTLVAAVAGKKIQVLNYVLSANNTGVGVDVIFKSGALTSLTGAMYVDRGIVVSFAGSIFGPAVQTATGEALILNLSAVRTITGHLSYVEVT